MKYMDKQQLYTSINNKELLKNLIITSLQKNKYYKENSLNIDEFLDNKMRSILNEYFRMYSTLHNNLFLKEMNKRTLEEIIPNLIENYKLLQEPDKNLMNKIIDNSNLFNYNTFIPPTQTNEKSNKINNLENNLIEENFLINEDILNNNQLLMYNAGIYENTYRKRDKKTEHTILIDSGDRDRIIYPNPNYYIVAFNSSDTTPKPHLSRNYKNVLSVEILEIIIPIDNVNHPFGGEPYILLAIDEINDNIDGTNNVIRKSIARIYAKDIRGDFVVVPTNYRKIYNRNTLGNISRLTIRFLNRDGTPYDFGADNIPPNIPDKKKQNSILLRITTLEPEIDEIIN